MSVTLRKKARGERPRYFDDPAIEKTLSIVLALAGEVAVLRDRLDSVERLAQRGAPFGPAEVDAFQPDRDARAARDEWRDQFLDIVLRAVHQELEGMEQHAEQGRYDDAVRSVETD